MSGVRGGDTATYRIVEVYKIRDFNIKYMNVRPSPSYNIHDIRNIFKEILMLTSKNVKSQLSKENIPPEVEVSLDIK